MSTSTTIENDRGKPLVVGVCSRGILKTIPLGRFLNLPGARYVHARGPRAGIDLYLGWGRKPSGRRAEKFAKASGRPFLLLEDGFLRSYGLGREGAEALSIVVDDEGMYYDATAPSRLERLLEEGNFSAEILKKAADVLDRLRGDGLSKYNCGRTALPENLFSGTAERVLVVDQTAGDASIAGGLASDETFREMLEAARAENPGAEIWVKTHPDVLAGKRRGCLPLDRERKDVRWITGDWHPHALLRHFGKVYVVTSQMGLDALIRGCEVHCFGMPFYAGWGLTHDRRTCARRTSRRTLPELVAAAYLQYSRYALPGGEGPADIGEVMDEIVRQKRIESFWERLPGEEWSGRVICFGFRLWKQAQVTPFFGTRARVLFARSMAHARRMGLSGADRIAVWGVREPAGLRREAERLGLDIVRVEDGFIRSVGLGADFVPPMSLVFDDKGIYFDPASPSRLEDILLKTRFDEDLRGRARELRDFIVGNFVTKYNTGDRFAAPQIQARDGQRVILVPGQVEDDASILRGAGAVRTNLDLLRAVRAANPDAFIIYKPHPDVMARNRAGGVGAEALLEDGVCDHVECEASITACLEIAHEVHTMTSLSGFDALLRGLKVVCYGAPFYAGWGLTEDKIPIPRRGRRLTLEELVAGVLLLYPRYILPGRNGFASAMSVAREIVRQRAKSPAAPDAGFRRKLRKWRYLSMALYRSAGLHARRMAPMRRK